MMQFTEVQIEQSVEAMARAMFVVWYDDKGNEPEKSFKANPGPWLKSASAAIQAALPYLTVPAPEASGWQDRREMVMAGFNAPVSTQGLPDDHPGIPVTQTQYDGLSAQVDDLIAQLADARELIRDMQEALEPFKQLADGDIHPWGRKSDYRNARTAFDEAAMFLEKKKSNS